MIPSPRKILVVQTAFIGDVVLTLPLVQVLHERFQDAAIDFVAVPAAAAALAQHPALHELIIFDKKGADSGVDGMFRIAYSLRRRAYDVAFVPHRSARSALVTWLGNIPRRIGFTTSTARLLFTDVVPYEKDQHEIVRDLSLLRPLGIEPPLHVLPTLHPSEHDRAIVTAVIERHGTQRPPGASAAVAIAPGSVWNTKRWLKEHFISLAGMLASQGLGVVLIGSREDDDLCAQIQNGVADGAVINLAGKLTLLQSAEVIRRCAVLVSNDSAPMHLAVGVRTPVVALFGPTVPRFGFAPLGPRDRIVERDGLSCRPCSIHGGRQCPIGTFDCMKLITPEQVFSHVQAVLSSVTKSEEQAGRTGERNAT